MVARIITGKNLAGIVAYNEQKVAKGVAQLIFASNYPLSAEELTYSQKLRRLENMAARNPGVTTNAVHISLNFDPREHLEEEKLRIIAATYMEKIGFGDQPFLVYRHWDAAHPHIHIVTTPVQASGQRIETHNIGRVKSEPARKEIERLFGLTVAESKGRKPSEVAQKVDLKRALYGKSETKNAISNVVRAVYSSYHYGSLAEYNTVLRGYGVLADAGQEGSLMARRRGLVYSLLGEGGERVGVPIKASALYGQPTLKNLEARFAENGAHKQQHAGRVRALIEGTFGRYTQISREDFTAALAAEGIVVLFQESAEGYPQGVTFVDHTSRTVLTEGELGSAYNAQALQKRFAPESLTLEDAKKYSVALAVVLSSLKKQTPAYYFESSLLRDLARVDLYAPLRRQFPGESETTLRLAIRNYTGYKTAQLPAVESREREIFRYHCLALLRFILQNNHLSQEEKGAFLAGNDIRVEERAEGVVLRSTRGSHIYHEENGASVASLLKGRSSQRAFPVPFFSRSEKQLFLQFGQLPTAPIRLEKHTITGVSLSRVRPYFTTEGYGRLEHLLNQNYLSEIRSRVELEGGVERLLQDLTLRGVLVYPVRRSGSICGYRMGYYQTSPANYVDAPPDVSDYLRRHGYSETTAAAILNKAVKPSGGRPACLRYDMAVRLQQCLDRGAYRQLYKTLEFIKNINEPFYHSLGFWVNLDKDAQNFKGEAGALFKIDERRCTRLLLDALVRYPHDDLRPPEPTAPQLSPGGTSIRPSAVQNPAVTLLGSLLECLGPGPAEAADSLPLELCTPKRKKKRRKIS